MAEKMNTDFGTASCIRRVQITEWERFADYRLRGMLKVGVSASIIAEMESWGARKWQADLGHPDKAFFVAVMHDEYVGHGCVFKTELDGQVCQEIVLEVGEESSGKGIGPQLYHAMRVYAETHHPNDTLIARIIPENMRSIRAAEKAGFSHADNVVSDGVVYRVYTPV